jgi:hypothetical protein
VTRPPDGAARKTPSKHEPRPLHLLLLLWSFTCWVAAFSPANGYLEEIICLWGDGGGSSVFGLLSAACQE